MIEWFTEDALLPTITGIFLVISLFGLFIYSSEKVMLYGALVIAALTAGIFTIEQMVVTDKERAYSMIYDAARAGRDNDDRYLLGLIKPDKTVIHNRAKATLDKIEFENVRVAGFKSYEASTNEDPATATISFVVFGSGRYQSFSGPFQVEVKLDLEMVEEQWKIVDFAHSNPRAGLGQ